MQVTRTASVGIGSAGQKACHDLSHLDSAHIWNYPDRFSFRKSDSFGYGYEAP